MPAKARVDPLRLKASAAVARNRDTRARCWDGCGGEIKGKIERLFERLACEM